MVDEHYWNYKIDPKQQDKSWGDSVMVSESICKMQGWK